MLKIKAPKFTEASMCVPCAQALTGVEQKYVSSPNLKTGGFKLYKHKEQRTFFFFFEQQLLFFCVQKLNSYFYLFQKKKKKDDDEEEEINK